MIEEIKYTRKKVIKSFIDVKKIFKEVTALLENKTIMFMYLGGSLAYDTFNKECSDIDINVFVDDFDTFIHTPCGDYDLFIYGKEYMMKRELMDEELPLYNRIFIDDKYSINDTLLYKNPQYQKEYEEFVNFDVTTVLKKYLENVYEYFMFLYVDNELPLKRFYHVIRIKGQLESYKKTGKYDLTIEKDYKDEAILFKDNLEKEIGKKIYLTKIGTYLEEFKKYAEEVLKWQQLI